MKVAIIDDGISSNAVDENILLKKYVVINDSVEEVTKYNDENLFSHGSICAKLFMLSNLSNIEMISIKIMEYNGVGDFKNLFVALNWCEDKFYNVINISAGICDWFHGMQLNKVCYRLNQKGSIIISANSNENKITFPAISPYVTSVEQYRKKILILSNVAWKTDIRAEGAHCLFQDGKRFITDKCNSYACAYISGKVASGISIWSLLDDKRIHIQNFELLEQKKIVSNDTINFGFNSVQNWNIQLGDEIILRWTRNKGLLKKMIAYWKNNKNTPKCILWCGKRMPQFLKRYCIENHINYWDEREFDCLKRTKKPLVPVVTVSGDLKLAHEFIHRVRIKLEDEEYRVLCCSDLKYSYIYNYWWIRKPGEIGNYFDKFQPDIILVFTKKHRPFSDIDILVEVESKEKFWIRNSLKRLKICCNNIEEVYEYMRRYYS